MRQVTSTFLWKGIGGPDKATKENSDFFKRVKDEFEKSVGTEWIRKDGGAKYGKCVNGGKPVCGWHMMNCVLRDTEIAAEDDESVHLDS